ncbi:hypothetical protein DPEC_G00351380 [Dallia pectoralis]|uniref:Uncharacterized protein n=1 Tax=Dallia pectoralis TaxID=75939 RepID=A0ACC2F213_DALPE|nr:hypothetical protein DPEC_G00351380 [Dallia pectoralis]
MFPVQLFLVSSTLWTLQRSLCHGACVEVDSDTDAVVNENFKLGCISCKMRAEVPATATVNWTFTPRGENETIHIYTYKEAGIIENERFYGRLCWNGSRNTTDLQDGSICLQNVTWNDTGTYNCSFKRILTFPSYEVTTYASKVVHLNVLSLRTRGMASILSEAMMYVTIIGLQLWLLVEMIYCYRKISAQGEEALRESASEYLAIALDSKDNQALAAVAE